MNQNWKRVKEKVGQPLKILGLTFGTGSSALVAREFFIMTYRQPYCSQEPNIPWLYMELIAFSIGTILMGYYWLTTVWGKDA